MSNTLFDSPVGPLLLHRCITPSTNSSNPAEFMGGPLDAAYQLVAVTGRAGVVGSTSCAFNIGKVTGSQPIGSATPLLSATINMLSSADTDISGTLIGSQALQQFAIGDCVVLMKSGIWGTTTVAGISCKLVRI